VSSPRKPVAQPTPHTAIRAHGPVWLFDLDDTLHDASFASMTELRQAMGEYIQRELQLTAEESNALRRRYWLRYGATLLGLVRHHRVKAAHFLHYTHQLPGLESRIRGHAHDLAALARLPGRKYILTNAPAAYARRVLGVLGIESWFDGLLSIEDLHMFGHLRPKPDARMMRRVAARLRVHPAHCVLVEDSAANLKGARRAGMQTVWLRRWLPAGSSRLAARRCPVYVNHRVRALSELQNRVGTGRNP
jgi:putative hydrolase of the HAD superfamily